MATTCLLFSLGGRTGKAAAKLDVIAGLNNRALTLLYKLPPCIYAELRHFANNTDIYSVPEYETKALWARAGLGVLRQY